MPLACGPLAVVAAAHHAAYPVRQVSLHRGDGTTEYVLYGPTEGSLQAPLERIRLSYSGMNVAVGRPCVFRGEVQVSVMVTLRP